MTKLNKVNRWIHPSLASDGELRQRVILLTASNIVMMLMPLIGLVSGLMGNSAETARTYGYPLVITTVLILMTNLATLYTSGNYKRAADVTIIVPFMTMLIAVLITGGPSHSPVIHVLLVPTILSFYLLGLRRALKLNLILILVFVFFMVLETQGFQFIQTLTAEHFPKLNRMMFFISFICAASVAAIYESTSSSLKHQRDEEHQRALDLANNDMLTGIANRRRFEDELNQSVRNATTSPYFSLCVIDLNGFKPINDLYGHQAGDEVIKTVARRIRNEIRNVDFVARMGGDEFVLIIRNVENHQSDPIPLLQRVMRCIEQPIDVGVATLRVTGSIGLALYPQHGDDSMTLLRAADTAMYTAKSGQGGIATAIHPSTR